MKLKKEFSDNDVYFMEVVADKILINDNYDGIHILDNEFNVIASIKVLNDMVIDVSFVKENEAVLCCYENKCMLHVDVVTCKYKIIPFSSKIKDLNFLALFEWVDSNLMLLSDNGTIFVLVDLLKNIVNVVPKSTVTKMGFSIYDDWNRMNKYTVHRVFLRAFEAVVEIDNKLILMNYKSGVNAELKTADIVFHDVEITDNCVALVSERAVSLLYKKQCKRIYPQTLNRFLRCKFIKTNETIDIIVLACDESNSLAGSLERYSVETDL